MGTNDRPQGARTGSSGTPRSELYRHSALGLQFAATLAVFGALGYWLDGEWGTAPWLLIGGIFAGFGLALLSMVRKVGAPAGSSARSPKPPAGPPGDSETR